jgi:hypothetical protein
MGYERSNLSKESLFGCSNESFSQAAGQRKPEAFQFSPTRRELPGSSFPEGYAADCDEPRMKLGKRRVLVRRRWVGEKVSLFSILLAREDSFKVIPKRKDHNAH